MADVPALRSDTVSPSTSVITNADWTPAITLHVSNRPRDHSAVHETSGPSKRLSDHSDVGLVQRAAEQGPRGQSQRQNCSIVQAHPSRLFHLFPICSFSPPLSLSSSFSSTFSLISPIPVQKCTMEINCEKRSAYEDKPSTNALSLFPRWAFHTLFFYPRGR